MKRIRYQLNVVMTQEENEVVRKLRDEYHINVSGCVKCFLEQKLAEQEQIKQIKQNKHEN